MGSLRLRVLGLLVALPACIARAEVPAKVFILFPIDKVCACIKPLTTVKRLTWEERPVSRRLFQIFYDSQTRRELFRFAVGTKIDSEWSKWWTYGIAAQGDFNGDGLEDYSWHGGDDTSDGLYVLMSSPQGYRKVDVYATLAQAWTRQYRTSAPDFERAGGDFHTAAERIERNGDTITLVATVNSFGTQRLRTYRLQVDDKGFVFTDK